MNRRQKQRVRRRGAALLVVIIVLTMGSLVGATLLRMAFVQRRQLLNERLRTQAARLAEAGVQRALVKHAADAAYTGEVWNVEVPRREASTPAEVAITVEKTAASPEPTLTVVAEFPKGATYRARIRRVLTLSTPPPTTAAAIGAERAIQPPN